MYSVLLKYMMNVIWVLLFVRFSLGSKIKVLVSYFLYRLCCPGVYVYASLISMMLIVIPLVTIAVTLLTEKY
jgi:hypothetical protein